MGPDPNRPVLVTGGAGFIGSNLVEALLRRGDSVRVLDDFSSGRRENLSGVPEWVRAHGARFELIEGSICDAAAVRGAVAGTRAILHHAAIASVPRSVADPLETEEVNAAGTLRLLEAARASGVVRFVNASSSAVYGESPELPKTEAMRPDPISPYGIAKLAAEHYANAFCKLHGLGTVSLRYFNVFGPRQDPKSDYAAVVPRFATAIVRGTAPVVYGDGEQTRDFNPVANVVAANLCALNAPAEACGKAYNIASGVTISLLDLIRRVALLAGRPAVPRHEPARAGDIRHSSADIVSARKGLGYAPAVTLDEGLRQTFGYYRSLAGPEGAP